MQCTEDYILDKELLNQKKIHDGFFSNLISVSSFIFTLIPSIIAWYISKDFKVMIIVLASCIFISLFYTMIKNIRHNKKLLKKVQDELIKSNKNSTKLKSTLTEKEDELSKLKNTLESIESNRNALVKMVEKYKLESNTFRNYYLTAKIGVTGIIRSNRITKDKEAILKLFEDIENDTGKDDSND